MTDTMTSQNINLSFWDTLYNSLIKHNVPEKLIKVIKLKMQRTKMKVKVNNIYSEWFETKTGTIQETLYPPYYLV